VIYDRLVAFLAPLSDLLTRLQRLDQ